MVRGGLLAFPVFTSWQCPSSMLAWPATVQAGRKQGLGSEPWAETDLVLPPSRLWHLLLCLEKDSHMLGGDE